MKPEFNAKNCPDRFMVVCHSLREAQALCDYLDTLGFKLDKSIRESVIHRLYVESPDQPVEGNLYCYVVRYWVAGNPVIVRDFMSGAYFPEDDVRAECAINGYAVYDFQDLDRGCSSYDPDADHRMFSAHEVACILAEATDEDCACNVACNDEWLPQYCDFSHTCCPNVAGVACWEQYLKYREKKYETKI